MTIEIPSLDETNHLQRDLDSLCAERPFPKSETFPPNAFYGVASILRAYAGLPAEFPIMAVVPHSVVLDPEFVWRTEVDAPVPGVLAYPPYRDDVYRATTDKVVIPSASPYLYATQMVETVPKWERRGLIFFPTHSTHHITEDMDSRALARSLAQADNRFGPITVCMYWRDVQLGRHVAFRDYGLKVVSAGHIYDPAFLFRLHWLCSQHSYSASNSVGSHIFFSMESGCQYVSIGSESHQVTRSDVRAKEPNGLFVSRDHISNEVVALLGYFASGAGPDGVAVARQFFLGGNRMMSPLELAEVLRNLRQKDRRGYDSDKSGTRIAPGWVRRSFPARAWRYLAQKSTRLTHARPRDRV